MNISENTNTDGVSTQPSFRLKGGLFPLTLLEITSYSREQFKQDLIAKVAQAPAFFQQTPVILSVDSALQQRELFELPEIIALCRSHGLIPVCLRGGNEQLQAQATQCSLALMPEGRSKPELQEASEPESEAPAVVEIEAEDLNTAVPQSSEPQSNPVPPVNKVITTPIRSGQQVYAPGGDLIVLSSVSTGAEVLADGNIHIYGALRGRALAGVRGDSSARIFCQSLEAELVSIAGNFKLDEDLRGGLWKQAIQVSLNGENLSIEALT